MERIAAECSLAIARQLVAYDHHVVEIKGRRGVMLAYAWFPFEEQTEPFVLEVVFAYANRHPTAPPSVQTIVDGLNFTPAPAADGAAPAAPD